MKHFVNKKDTVSTIPPLCTVNEITPVWHVTDEEKAETLNSYFASVSSLDDSQAELPPLTELTDASIDNIEITEDEVIDVIVNLDPNKKVQVGKDQEKAQSEKDSHSKNRGGKKPN